MAAAAAWVRIPVTAFGQPAVLTSEDEARLRAVAEVVLPGELSAAARLEVVDEFLRWVRGYREGAEMDHGYGFPRLRRLPPHPAARYPAQLAALDRAAGSGGTFASLEPGRRRALVAAAIDAAKIERLPVRPTGEHVATDLMGFYFYGAAANDLAYGVAIRRDSCRGLPGSELPPPRLEGRTGVGPGSDPGPSTNAGRLKMAGRVT